MTGDAKLLNSETLSQNDTEVDFFQDSAPKSSVRRCLLRAVSFIRKHKLYSIAAAAFVLLSLLGITLTLIFYETDASRKAKADKIDSLLVGQSLYNCYPSESPVDSQDYLVDRDESVGQFIVRTLKEYGYSTDPEKEAKVYLEFNSFMANHKKTYFTSEEKSSRYINFRETLNRVNAHNEKEDASYKLGINQYSDLSRDELNLNILNLNVAGSKFLDREKLPAEQFFLPDLNQKLPADFSWAELGVVGPVLNQGHCGSCWAFSVAGASQSLYNMHAKSQTVLSPQELLDCIPEFNCQVGGNPDIALDYVTDNGLSTLKEYPYLAIQKKCAASASKFKAYINGKYYIDNHFDYALAQGSPIVIAMYADDDFVSYSAGIYKAKTSAGFPNHALLLVGFGENAETNQKYWIVKNSWGENWGEDGYIRILRTDDYHGFGCANCAVGLMPNFYPSTASGVAIWGIQMCDFTYICRSKDGYPLVESWEDSVSSNFKANISNDVKTIARSICKKLDESVTRCSLDESNVTYHYFIKDGICYMTVCPASYPKKLAFAYLNELSNAFGEEIVNHFGTTGVDYRSAIETIDAPYPFISFDRSINKIKRKYTDPGSVSSLSRLNENLTEVTHIMKRNIDEIINRGETLEDMNKLSRDLLEESTKFKETSKLLNSKNIQRVIAGVIILVFLYVIFAVLF